MRPTAPPDPAESPQAGSPRRVRQLREVNIGVAGPMGRTLPFMRGIFLGGMRASDADFQRLRDDSELWAILPPVQASNANRLAGLKRAREETHRMLRALEADRVLRPAR